MSKTVLRRVERICLNSWWVVLFLIACLFLYEQEIEKRREAWERYQTRLAALAEEKHQALALQDNLRRQINSQSDPAWVELTLMRVLGLVPEGYKKVFFPLSDGDHG